MAKGGTASPPGAQRGVPLVGGRGWRGRLGACGGALEATAEGGWVWRHDRGCCLPQHHVRISPSEFVGAKPVGGPGGTKVQLWWCPLGFGKKLQRTLVKRTIKFDAGTDVPQLLQALQPRKAAGGGRVAVVLNPSSGTRKGLRVWNKLARPFFEAAGTEVEFHATTEAGHATRIAADLDPRGLRCVAVFGGDGTVHEVLQGILGRSDWAQTSKIPLAQVPVGSGNALAASCGFFNPVTALWGVLEGAPRPIDVASIIQPPHRRFSFLSTYIGLLSNLDVGTDDLRWMGDIRFTYGAVSELTKGTRHSAKVAFVPHRPTPAAAEGEGDGNGAKDGAKKGSASSSPRRGRKRKSRCLTSVCEGQHEIACPILDQLDVPGGGGGGVTANLPAGQGGEVLSQEEFQLLAAINLPKIAANGGAVTPNQTADSGSYTLIYNKKASFPQQVGIMLGLDEGTHLKSKFIETRDIQALILDPVATNSEVVVDGEVVHKAPLYLEVHPSLCRVLANPTPRPAPLFDPSEPVLPKIC